MGFRASSIDFKKWYEKTLSKPADMEDPQVKLLYQAYEQGFYDGGKEMSTYDPRWDAD